MNIQRPVLASNASLLPVLLFFHGGGFQGGSGNSIDPTALVAESIQTGQPVIVATINYRLGLFGFLASSELARLAGVDRAGHALQQSMSPTVVRDGSSDSTSDEQSEENNEFDLNLTFKDMQQSIRWLSENAAAFGGDPAKVSAAWVRPSENYYGCSSVTSWNRS